MIWAKVNDRRPVSPARGRRSAAGAHRRGLDHTGNAVVHGDHEVVGLLARPPWLRLVLYVLLRHWLRVLHGLRMALCEHRSLHVHHVWPGRGVW